MNTQDVEKIIKMFESATIETLDLEIDNIKIKLKKNSIVSPASATISNAPAKEDNTVVEGYTVKSPLVGTFYKSPSADAAPFVKKGDIVKEGDKLCIVEAMKVMNEITAPCDGVIKEIYVENECMVEFNQPLFLIGDNND